MATPLNPVDLDKLVEQLEAVVADPGSVVDAGTKRATVKNLARAAAAALEDPFETPLPLVTARIGQQQKIFAVLAQSTQPVPLATLAAETKLDSRILEPIMDYACTQNMAREVVPGRYLGTKISHLMMAPLFQDAVTHFHDNCLPAFGALNTVLDQPDKELLAFKVGQHTDRIFYEWMETHPVQQDAFHRFMHAQFASLPIWLDVVDFQSELGQELTGQDVAFVDVGGGNGQQCESLLKRLPKSDARVILQDRPEVLEKAPSVPGMEKQSYDFFTEQPVKGARVYYFRQIMHNYPDETCLRILRSHIPALGSRSFIVIDDKTLPDDKPSPDTPGVEYTAGLSLAMKAMFDAQERREAHWRELLTCAGLAIKDIRKFTNFDDSVIIATKKGVS